MGFFLETLFGGLMVGTLYALIAIGFVLIFKASGVFNFAQGAMVYFAALSLVGCMEKGAPLWLAIILAFAVMTLFGIATEKFVLRKMVNQAPIALFMATIGLAAVLRGLTPVIFGGETRAVPLPIGDEPIDLGIASLSPVQVLGSVTTLILFVAFSWFFKKSRMGVAMRAVADNQQVAQAMGINVERYFALAWAMAGIVSALGGIIWGSMLGVDVHLALVGLKVFPVVILGGLDSVGGALIGGLIIGIVESLVAGYLDPYVGGGTKDFAPYVLMIIVLMIKPYGLFGTKEIERV